MKCKRCNKEFRQLKSIHVYCNKCYDKQIKDTKNRLKKIGMWKI